MLLGDRTQGCRTGSSFQLGSRGSEVRPATMPKHPTLTLRPWRIIPTLPTPTPGSLGRKPPRAPQLEETPETPPSSRAEGLLYLHGLESNPG